MATFETELDPSDDPAVRGIRKRAVQSFDRQGRAAHFLESDNAAEKRALQLARSERRAKSRERVVVPRVTLRPRESIERHPYEPIVVRDGRASSPGRYREKSRIQDSRAHRLLRQEELEEKLEFLTMQRELRMKRTGNISDPTKDLNSQVFNGVTTVLDPTQQAKNVAVELELEIVDDLEDELEEFNRLRRMGRFNEARKFFQERLDMHLSNPYVLVQYAEMLLSQGDYGAFDAVVSQDIRADLLDSHQYRYLKLYWRVLKVFRDRYDSDRPTGEFEGDLWTIHPYLDRDANLVCGPVLERSG
jgi:hypothetical protein